MAVENFSYSEGAGMLTASVVLYKTPREQTQSLLESVLSSCIERLFIIDNSPDDSRRILGDALWKEKKDVYRLSTPMRRNRTVRGKCFCATSKAPSGISTSTAGCLTGSGRNGTGGSLGKSARRYARE